MTDATLYYVNDAGEANLVFTFKNCTVGYEFNKAPEAIEVPGQLLPIMTFDWKTMVRKVSVKGVIIAGGTYSAGAGTGTMAQQLGDFIGYIYDVTSTSPLKVQFKGESDSSYSSSTNRAAQYLLRVPIPDGSTWVPQSGGTDSNFEFMGVITGFRIDFEQANSQSIPYSFEMTETPQVVGFG